MKKFLCVAVAFVVVGLLGANLISQNEGLVAAALSDLKLESIAPKPGLIGAPPQFKVTRQTIEYLGKLQKDKKTIEVRADGSLRIVDKSR